MTRKSSFLLTVFSETKDQSLSGMLESIVTGEKYKFKNKSQLCDLLERFSNINHSNSQINEKPSQFSNTETDYPESIIK